MKTNELKTDSRPLAERITQGTPLETQINHLRLSPQGTPTVQIFDAGKQNIAAFVNEADGQLFTEAFNVTHETGRTPRQLAEERDKYANRCDHLSLACEVWQRQQISLIKDIAELREVLNLAYQEMFADAIKKGSGQHGTSLVKIALILNKHETRDAEALATA